MKQKERKDFLVFAHLLIIHYVLEPRGHAQKNFVLECFETLKYFVY